MILLAIILLITTLCGLLGSYAGASGTAKAWRRYGIPVLLTLLALVMLHSWWCLILLGAIIPLSMGYGIPSPGDDGSTLGRFFWLLCNKNEFQANIATRSLLAALEWSVFSVLGGHHTTFMLYTILGIVFVTNMLIWAVFVKNEGLFTFFGKQLLWEEFYIWAGYGLCAGIIILF